MNISQQSMGLKMPTTKEMKRGETLDKPQGESKVEPQVEPQVNKKLENPQVEKKKQILTKAQESTTEMMPKLPKKEKELVRETMLVVEEEVVVKRINYKNMHSLLSKTK